MRKLFTIVMGTTFAAVACWTVITMFGESAISSIDPATNETLSVEIPRLPIKAQYPWNPSSSTPVYFLTFGFQVYYLLFSVVHANSSDVLFCSWVLFACEQLQHLKVSFSIDKFERCPTINDAFFFIHRALWNHWWNYLQRLTHIDPTQLHYSAHYRRARKRNSSWTMVRN